MQSTEEVEARKRRVYWDELKRTIAHIGMVPPSHLTGADLEAIVFYLNGIPPEDWSAAAMACRPLVAPVPSINGA